jgi:hypothetical protein
MSEKVMLDVGTKANEIPKDLFDKIFNWMKEEIGSGGLATAIGSSVKTYESAFDLAVYCAHDLKLVHEEQSYAIPVYVIEIGEKFLGKD